VERDDAIGRALVGIAGGADQVAVVVLALAVAALLDVGAVVALVAKPVAVLVGGAARVAARRPGVDRRAGVAQPRRVEAEHLVAPEQRRQAEDDGAHRRRW
jgi:hypothetical protein